MALTDREKLVISRFVGAFNNSMGASYVITEWPDATNRSSKDVDAVATDANGDLLAIEHTLLQPFEGERRDTSIFLQTIATLDKKPGLILNGFNVTLSVKVGAVSRAIRDQVAPAIEQWYIGARDAIAVGRSVHAVTGLPTPFEVGIYKRPTSGAAHFHVSREMPADTLEAVVEKALKDKLPKLVARKATRRILLIEVGSLATDFGAAELIEHLKPKYPDLESIDSVWMINTVALEDEDYSPSYLVWPLQAAYDFDLARNGGA